MLNNVFIPQLSVDQYAGTMARWFGLSDTQIAAIFPNISNFNNRYIDFLAAPAVLANPQSFPRPGLDARLRNEKAPAARLFSPAQPRASFPPVTPWRPRHDENGGRRFPEFVGRLEYFARHLKPLSPPTSR